MIRVYYLYSTEFGSGLSNMRYIGQTKKSLERRLYLHIWKSLKGNYKSYLYDWIRSVYANGFEVKVGLLVDGAIWNITEMEQIKKYKDLGYKLTNLTDGGGGCLGIRHTESSRKNMSISKKGMKYKPMSEQGKRNLSVAHKGKVGVNLGKRFSDEWRENIRKGGLGNKNASGKRSEEVKARMKGINKGIKRSKEFKENLSKKVKLWWINRKKLQEIGEQ